MAITASFASLSTPVVEDTMEMSSPANRGFDEDIDLDFGDDTTAGGVPLGEDEQMLTDGEPTRLATATDEMMNDDPVDAVVQEEIMDDDLTLVVANDGDEELIDYSDDEIEDQPPGREEPTTLAVQESTITDTPLEIPEQVVQVDEEVIREPEQLAPQQSLFDHSLVTEKVGAATHDFAAEISGRPFAGSEERYEEPRDPSRDQQDKSEAVAVDAGGSVDAAVQNAEQTVDVPADEPQWGLALDTAVTAESDTPATPTDTGLHPVTVSYADLQMPLFKSKRQPGGLLKDDNLASLSLAQLLQNCRQRIAVKIGVVSDDHELVVSFDDLFMRLGEDSRAAFASSLNDILDVYLQLHQNDGTQDVPPLSLTFSVQPKFTSSLALLKQAAKSGQGMQPFSLMHRQEEDEEYDQEETGGDGILEPADTEEQYEEQDAPHAETKQEPEENHEQAAGERQQELDTVEEEHFGEAYAGEHEHGETTANSSFDVSTTREAAALASDDAREPEAEGTTPSHADDVSEAALHSGAFEGPAPAEDKAELEDGTHDEIGNAVSTASSTTVQGDQPDDSFEPSADDHTDFSTFVAELETEGAKDGSHYADAQEPQEADEAQAHQVLHEAADLDGTTIDQSQQPENFGSEDFLHEFEKHQHQEPAHYLPEAEHDIEHGFQEEDYLHTEEHDDQADTYDEQQEGFQPGEDDEQFHTAHDFVNEDYYEHGPEHDVAEGEEEEEEEEEHHVVETAAGSYENDQPPGQNGPLDPEDDIGFDDETTEQHEARTVPLPETAAGGGPASPLGKRSFHEAADEDDLADDEPEPKKMRSE